MASSDVLSVFPTLIWEFALAAGAREALNAKLIDALEGMRPSPGGMPPGHGWQSSADLHTLEECQELVAYVRDAVGSILRFLKAGYQAFEITACWANINPPGAAHRSHSHPNNFLSGVYYVRTQPGADTINFHDPRIQTGIIRPPVRELTAANADQAVVRVSAGTLLVFPAWLQHSVDANESRGERISISFNVMFSAFTENLSKPLW
jgi:uncharacterized protein (TIGR02466 family)